MDSGWLLADGEAVASAQHVRTFRERRRAARSARRGELAVVLRPPAVVLGPLDVICVRDGTAVAVRAAGRRPVCVVRRGTVVVVGPGTAERHGVHPGSAVELRWAT
jgi:urease accessory protein UreE